MRSPPTSRTCLLLGFGALCAALLVPACRTPEAGLHVVVEGSLLPGEDFDRLSLVAFLASDRTPLFVETVEGDGLGLPASFNLLSGPGTPAGTAVHLLASAEREGQVVSAARADAALAAGEGGRVTLVLPELLPPPDAGAPVELCDDGFDDDGDGLSDCADPDCDGKGCAPGGMVCLGGGCGCASGTVGAWRPALPGFVARQGAQALLLAEGSRAGWLAIAGGGEAAGPSAVVELFRPGLETLEEVTLTAGRREPGFAELPGGGLVLVGGEDDGGLARGDYEQVRFDGAGPQVTRVDLEPALATHAALVRPSGAGFFILGGSLGDRLVKVEAATGGAAAWTELDALAAPRSRSAALGDGRWVLASGPSATDSVDVLLADGGIVGGPPLPVALAGAALARTSGGRVLVVGGGPGPSARAFLLEAQGGGAVVVRETGALPAPLGALRAVTVEGGWVYVQDTVTFAAFWFDPAAEAFLPATAHPAPRTGDALASFGRNAIHLGGALPGGALDGTAFIQELRCATP